MKNEKTFIINCREEKIAAVNAVKSIMKDGPVMMVKIYPYHRDRSKDQNSAYWRVLLRTLEDNSPFTANVWHEFFKKMFVPSEMVTVHGMVIEMHQTTTKMTVAEFTEYMEKIRKWVAENRDIVLPEIDSEKKTRR